MAAKAKTPIQSSNFWTGIITLLTLVLAFFHITPDTQVVENGVAVVTPIIDALASKNWIGLVSILIASITNIVNMAGHLLAYFKSKSQG